MKNNGLKQLWAQDKQGLNGWLSVPNAFTAEVMGSLGYDSLTVDMQHGLVDYADMVGMLQALSSTPVTALVRVPWLDPASIMKSLDAGAQGIICPMVNTRAQAEEFVDYMRYPPRGSRSFGPIRARYALGADYVEKNHEEVVALAMIETAEAMDNLDAIVSTPGLDGVYIGPSDLTFGLSNGSLPAGMDREEPEMVAAIERILKAAHDAGIRACLHTASTDYAVRGFKWGFDMVTMASDVMHMAQGAGAAVKDVKSRT